MYIGSVLIGILVIATLVRGISLDRYYKSKAMALPIEQCARLDGSKRISLNFGGLVNGYAPALRYAPREVPPNQVAPVAYETNQPWPATDGAGSELEHEII